MSQRTEQGSAYRADFVALALTNDNTDALPTLFTTYDTSTAFEECTIWQVARATSAATFFFESIKIGRDETEFVDAAFGYSNPCDVLLTEATQSFPDREMRIVSLGTGHQQRYPTLRTRRGVAQALKTMATSSQKVALGLNKRFGDRGVYHRFNVDHGMAKITLSDWKKSSNIAVHTKNYLDRNGDAIQRCVEALTCFNLAEPGMIPVGESGQANQERPIHVIKFAKNAKFVRRPDAHGVLEKKLFGRDSVQRVALVGLGGVGKTQVAGHLAHWVQENKPGYSVFLVSASSMAVFEYACVELARELVATQSENEDARETVRRHLSSENTGRWFLILEDVDEMDILEASEKQPHGILEFLPWSESGRILFTTRLQEVAVAVAGPDTVRLHPMNRAEAETLLEKSLMPELQSSKEGLVAEFLEHLSNFPLAIVQASLYMNTKSLPISKYLDIFRNTAEDAADRASSGGMDLEAYDPGRRAALTTWRVSFTHIRTRDEYAAKLLSFIAYIEPKAIPRSLLPHFASKRIVMQAIGTLIGYGLLTCRGDVYDMHGLVHFATWWEWNQDQQAAEQAQQDVLKHLTDIFPSPTPYMVRNRGQAQQYLPHVLRVLDTEWGAGVSAFRLRIRVGQWLLIEGLPKEAVKLLETGTRIRQQMSKDSLDQLEFQQALAAAYRANGRAQEALELLETVVAVRKEGQAEDDRPLLKSQHCLAGAYRAVGRVADAIELLEVIVAIREETPKIDEQDLLTLKHELGGAYRENGQLKEAVGILEDVAALRNKEWEPGDSFRLASQFELAGVYRANGDVEKAISILHEVIGVQAQMLQPNHPSLLASRHELAVAYRHEGKVDIAIEILEDVVENARGKFHESHLSLLAYKHELGAAFRARGELGKAVDILEDVVAVAGRSLPHHHSSRLAYEHELGVAYRAKGDLEKAIKMLEKVVAVAGEYFPDNHAPRLAYEHELGGAYIANGQGKEAVKILKQVVKVKRKDLKRNDPSLLASEFELGAAYRAKGNLKKAVDILEAVVLKRRRSGFHNDVASRRASEHELRLAYGANRQFVKAGILKVRLTYTKRRKYKVRK